MADTITSTQDSFAAAIAAGKAIGAPIGSQSCRHGRSTEPSVIVPDGYSILPLPMSPELPETVDVRLDLDNVDSFVRYINDFKLPNTRIFSMTGNGTLLAIIDYHQQRGAEPVEACAHRVSLTPRRTKEWLAWTNNAGKPMTQDTFAAFIEQWSGSIWSPDAATMMEIALSFEATKSMRFKSTKRLQDGQREFMYQEEINGTSTSKGVLVSIPSVMKLHIMRCYGETAHSLEAKLRYRVNEDKLSMWFEIHHLDEAEEEAQGELCDIVKKETGIDPFSTAGIKNLIG